MKNARKISLPFKLIVVGLLIPLLISCIDTKKEQQVAETYSDIKIIGAMKNVVWKGELDSSIRLDTISDRNGLYGLGPVSYLEGELLINDGQSYVSKVVSDATMTVEKSFDISAPFFVYANVTDWEIIELDATIKTIADLEKFIDEKTTKRKRPFAFKLLGKVSKAKVHVQNLPKGATVSSPEEAHQGQANFEVSNIESVIIGFFSTEHQGVFTHHDSFLHMHLITEDETIMGHLDELEIEDMKLYLPKN